MIERLPSPGGNGLGFKASGEITKDDFKRPSRRSRWRSRTPTRNRSGLCWT